MKILVTGGLGFIGSHVVVELQQKGFEVLIVDNLSNASEHVLEGIASITGQLPVFENIDLRDKGSVRDFFSRHEDLSGVIHFAASKAVEESVLLYYENNLTPLIYLLQELEKNSVEHFIFSSSCTVYGEAAVMPITEDMSTQVAQSPYGNTKQIGEEIIRDVCTSSDDLSAIALRYFNPIGAHESALIGELPMGVPQNLIPYIMQTAAGLRDELLVFGDDYTTLDGTCIRDYIHVVDLAKAHVAALNKLLHSHADCQYGVYNIGTGKGSSVMEVIEAFEKISGKKLHYRIVGRRDGDIVSAYADTDKAYKELHWQSENSLEEALASAWKWQQNLSSKG